MPTPTDFSDESSSDWDGTPTDRNNRDARAASEYDDVNSFHRERMGTLLVDQPRDFTTEVTEMRSHIRKMRSRVRTSNRWLGYLDVLVGCCVLFVSMVSPVDICFSRTSTMNFVFFIGIFCNAVFALDVGVRFNRSYREESAQGGGRWVRSRRKITARYLKTWFLVDLCALCPLDLPFVLGLLDATQGGLLIRIVILLRLVRCAKIIQVVPIVMHVLTTRLAMTNASTELLKFGVLLVLLVHYLACFWAFVGLNWEPSEDSSAAFERTWIQGYGFENYAMHRLYAVSVYVSIVAIFGGVSSVAPQNFLEYVSLTCMMFVGGLTWAYVLSMLCAIFSKLDPRVTDHKNMMDELSYFMEERDFESDHKERLRDFFNYTRDFARESGYSAIFERMSNKLRADTALIMGETHVQLVWYLHKSKCEVGFLCEVALNLKPALYEIHEPLPIKKLTVLTRGLVAQQMRLIGAGKVLGTDCILQEAHWGLRNLDPVMCLSYVQVSCISRDTLYSLAKEYPQAARTLGEAARHMTVRAALVKYYREYVKRNRMLPGRVGIDDVASEMVGGKGGRRGSQAKKEMLEQGDSRLADRALESQIHELKGMVLSLVEANGGSLHASRRGSPTMLRRHGSHGKFVDDHREGSRGRRADSRDPSRYHRGTKEGPGRARSPTSRSRSGGGHKASRGRDHLEA